MCLHHERRLRAHFAQHRSRSLQRPNTDTAARTLGFTQFRPGVLVREKGSRHVARIDASELEKDEYRDVRWVVEEVLSIVNGLDLPAIHEDLSFRQRRAVSRRVRASDEKEQTPHTPVRLRRKYRSRQPPPRGASAATPLPPSARQLEQIPVEFTYNLRACNS